MKDSGRSEKIWMYCDPGNPSAGLSTGRRGEGEDLIYTELNVDYDHTCMQALQNDYERRTSIRPGHHRPDPELQRPGEETLPLGSQSGQTK